MKQKEYIEKHIATHTAHSAEDRSAVSYLESVLNPGGRICTSFSSDDKWPNHDGFFEYVSNPDISKIPKQNFIVQIKGTHDFSENNGVISYCLKSLSFPAFIANEVTADPGILFVVLNPDTRNGKRIFWKVMSKSFLSDIDFEKNSKTIKFSAEDEIKNTDESIELFCERLDSIIDTHLFLNKLNSDDLEQKDALSIIEYQCNEISYFIETLYDNPQCRDEVSRRIVRDLYDICYATLILNAYKNGYRIFAKDCKDKAEFVAEGAAIPVYDSAGDFNEKTIESYKLASIVTLDGEDFLAYYGERKLILRVAFERYLRNHPELRRRV